MSIKENRKGFTLSELLVVVAIIAVLVAIAIPVFSAQLHKSKVGADWANVRAYYGEIQSDYVATGKYNDKVKNYYDQGFDWNSITFLNGQNVKLEAGYYGVSRNEDKGYWITYYCNDGHDECSLELKND